MSRRQGPAVYSFLLTASLLAAVPAAAQCIQADEARAVRQSIRLAVRCNYRILRSGLEATCKQGAAPDCAGTLVTDTVALAYGPNDPPASAVDRRMLKEQLRCQQWVGKAAESYVSKYLRLLVRGVSEDEADEKAKRQLDRLPEKCAVSVTEDVSGVVLPAVGPQCAAAVGAPGDAVEGEPLRDCLHTLLRLWVERFGPDPRPLRPNVVFILTDDQRWDTTDATHSPFGTDIMPRLRAELGESGIELTEAFMTTPLCCPSRASILLGQYAHTTGIHSNKPPNGGAEAFDDTSTLGTWLEAAGYRTGFLGKYLNGYHNLWDATQGEPPYVAPGWSEWHVFHKPRFFDYTLIRNGVAVEYGSAEEDYSTDVLRQLAVEFIDSSVALGQPFFLYVNFKAPHLPKQPAPRHVGMFDGVAPWRPESFNEPDVWATASAIYVTRRRSSYPTGRSSTSITVSECSPVDLASVPDLDDENDVFGIVNGVDDPVIAMTHSVPIDGAGQLLTARWTRIGTQRLNARDEAPAVALLSNRLEFLRGRAFDL